MADGQRAADASALRLAAGVLLRRARRKTFMLGVLIRVLEDFAGQLEKEDEDG